MDITANKSAMLVGLIFGFALIIANTAFAALPKEGERVAVFTWPSADEATVYHVIADADARLVSPGRTDWIAVADGGDRDIVGNLYRAGALFVMDARFAEACQLINQPRP